MEVIGHLDASAALPSIINCLQNRSGHYGIEQSVILQGIEPLCCLHATIHPPTTIYKWRQNCSQHWQFYCICNFTFL